jgi:hypothetical protein
MLSMPQYPTTYMARPASTLGLARMPGDPSINPSALAAKELERNKTKKLRPQASTYSAPTSAFMTQGNVAVPASTYPVGVR